MLRIPVDFNDEDNDRTMVIRPRDVPDKCLSLGARVVIYEPGGGLECEAIVRRGRFGEWVAEIVEGTVSETDGMGPCVDPA